jgi:hypothetical protein
MRGEVKGKRKRTWSNNPTKGLEVGPEALFLGFAGGWRLGWGSIGGVEGSNGVFSGPIAGESENRAYV